MELLTRHFDIRATPDSDGLTLTGIGVPFDSETEIIPGYFERFAPGAVEDDEAILRYGHSEPLGVIGNRTDTAAGRKITARISDTPRGREIATLIRDGVLSKFSIGFYPIEYDEDKRSDGIHVTIRRAKVVEYSIVEFPAYNAATITSIRSATNQKENPEMSTTTHTATDNDTAEIRAAIAALDSGMEDLGREIRSITSNMSTTAAEIPVAFRSIGEYAKALATGNQDARNAYDGATSGMAIHRPGWLGLLEKRMAAKQVVTNLFTHTFNLPDDGSTVEYAVRKTPHTIMVAEQENEGDALTKGKPSSYEIKAAEVKTYGGYSVMTRQVLDRCKTISLLDDVLYDQAMEYALAIETKTRAVFSAAVATAEQSPIHTIARLAESTVNDWITIALKLIDKYDKTPYVMDGILVSGDVFDALAKMPKDAKALQFTGAPDDHQGTITVPTGSGEFSTIHIQRVPNWEGSHAVAFSREAIRVLEAPGAPFRLGPKEDIENLTAGVSVYGYATHFVPKPELLMAVKFTA